jgi:glycosyltransferase involved in cell wall biosynthesis
MIIGWNTTLLQEKLSGIGNYIEKILMEIKKREIKDRIILLGSNNYYDYSKINFKNNIFLSNGIISRNRIFRILWEQIILPIKAKKNNIDILHCPAHVLPLFYSQKTVLTIHDLAFKLFPKAFKWQNRFYLNFIVPLSIKKADRIIAVSKNTKKDIIEEYNIDSNKIKVIYNGVNEKYREIRDEIIINKVKEKYKLPKKFILYLGTLEPRKNIKRLIKAFNKVKKSDTKLVIAGGKGWLYDDIFELVKTLNLENEIIFTGYVDEEDIVPLYNAATVFVYPSLYEGFGLPPLEAMACGTPVITSNVSSLPEVVGEAAITIDPYNIEDISSAIRKVLNSEKLKENLSKKGIQQSKKFSWKKTTEETLNLYREII